MGQHGEFEAVYIELAVTSVSLTKEVNGDIGGTYNTVQSTVFQAEGSISLSGYHTEEDK